LFEAALKAFVSLLLLFLANAKRRVTPPKDLASLAVVEIKVALKCTYPGVFTVIPSGWSKGQFWGADELLRH
jgi:hypothetical protein